jgi:hypothetical protein
MANKSGPHGQRPKKCTFRWGVSSEFSESGDPEDCAGSTGDVIVATSRFVSFQGVTPWVSMKGVFEMKRRNAFPELNMRSYSEVKRKAPSGASL